jgi:hydroxymethylglutaryl-CoA reductase
MSTLERRARLQSTCGLSEEDLQLLDSGGLTVDDANRMVENVVGRYALPFAVATNFVVNGREVLIPMVIEESSVVAAASNAAKMVRAGGGFVADVTPPIMIGQVELGDVCDASAALTRIDQHATEILALARALVPNLVQRGGGPLSIEGRVLEKDTVVVHVLVDVRDAMGANMVNTVVEGIAEHLAALVGARHGLRILSNLSTHRRVTVRASVPDAALADKDGASVRAQIVRAHRFAELDPYRAATHNKGIMNGVDAVLLATANDWRGVEAGAHAYAAESGRYRPLSVWEDGEKTLQGKLDMPLAVGTVGGAISSHPLAQLALAILRPQSAGELAAMIGAAGLATNLASLRALATDGINRGHMPLHSRKLT